MAPGDASQTHNVLAITHRTKKQEADESPSHAIIKLVSNPQLLIPKKLKPMELTRKINKWENYNRRAKPAKKLATTTPRP
jgi:hypothetical protein